LGFRTEGGGMKVSTAAAAAAVLFLLFVLGGCATPQLAEAQEELSQTYYNLGNTYMRLGNHESAVQAYRRALELTDRFPDASCNLAIALCRSGKYAAAERELSMLLEEDPENTVLLEKMAWCLLQDERLEESVRYYRKALRVDPGDSNIRESLMYVLMDLEKYSEARREALTLLEERGIDQELLLLLYEIDEQLADKSGYPWLEEAWKRDAAHKKTVSALLEYHLGLGDVTAAAYMLETYAETGDEEHAAELMKKFVEEDEQRKPLIEDILESIDEERRKALLEELNGLFE